MTTKKKSSPKKAPPRKGSATKPAAKASGEARTGWSDELDVKSMRVTRFRPQDLHVNFEANTSRSALYTYRGKPCCFSKDEPAVKERIESLLQHGQESPIQVWADNRKRPHVCAGFLRTFCFFLLEDQGRLDQVPRSDGYITAIKVPQPKTESEYLERASANVHENLSKPLTDIDIAWALRRFVLPIGEGGEFGLGRKEGAKHIVPIIGRTLSPAMVGRYMQLLALPPRTLGKIHRGELAMSKALREASENGEGVSRGPRAGIKVPYLRKVAPFLPEDSEAAVILKWVLEGTQDDLPPLIAAAVEKLAAAEAAG